MQCEVRRIIAVVAALLMGVGMAQAQVVVPSPTTDDALAWNPPTGSEPVTRYEWQVQPGATYASVGTNLTVNLPALVDGSYTAFVRACNAGGCGSPATLAFVVQTPTNPPGAPVTLRMVLGVTDPTLNCAPATQTARVGSGVTYTASGGNGTYAWSSTGATPATGSAATYAVTYATTGNKSATVMSGAQAAACQATITAQTGTAAYRSHTTNSYIQRTGSTSVAAPAGMVDGDYVVLIFLAGAAPNPTATITPPAGFIALPGFPSTEASGGFRVDLRAYYRIAAGEPASYVVSHSGGSVWTQSMAIAFSGASGVPQVSGIGKGVGTTGTAPGLAAVPANAAVAFIEHNWDLYGQETAPTGSTPTFVERSDVSTSLLYLATGTMTASGATGNKAHGNGNNGSGGWQAFLLSLAPQ